MEEQETKTGWEKVIGYFPLLPALAVLAIVIGALTGYHAGTTETNVLSPHKAKAAPVSAGAVTVADGTYRGSAEGYNGPVTVEVTVKDKKITEIEVVRHTDTPSFFNRAKSVIASILQTQSTEVDTVSGATYSSNGIKNAIKNALGQPVRETKPAPKNGPAGGYSVVTGPPEGAVYKDGVYTGSGKGFRGTTKVQVTIKDGQIADVKILSYEDDKSFFERARAVAQRIVKAQSTDVDGVSGATFSSNSIKSATANALHKAVVKEDAEAVSTTAAAKGSLKDGTYTVTSTVKPLAGNPEFEAYDITLTVTVKDGRIADVTHITSDTDETNKMFLSMAANTIPADVIKAQSAEVDTVSGATCSSKAILDGIETAIRKAG